MCDRSCISIIKLFPHFCNFYIPHILLTQGKATTQPKQITQLIFCVLCFTILNIFDKNWVDKRCFKPKYSMGHIPNIPKSADAYSKLSHNVSDLTIENMQRALSLHNITCKLHIFLCYKKLNSVHILQRSGSQYATATI